MFNLLHRGRKFFVYRIIQIEETLTQLPQNDEE